MRPATRRAELLGGDGPVPVLVEEGESLLELGDLLLRQLVSHPDTNGLVSEKENK